MWGRPHRGIGNYGRGGGSPVRRERVPISSSRIGNYGPKQERLWYMETSLPISQMLAGVSHKELRVLEEQSSVCHMTS